MRLWLVLFLVALSTVAQAQSTSMSIPGAGGPAATNTVITDAPCAANEIPARNAGNDAWVCTTNASGGAPTNAGYWTVTDDATLSSDVPMDALATGLVINTAGVPSIYGGAAACAAGTGTVRALNASGASTCSPVVLSGGDVSGTLTVDKGGRGITTVTDDGVDVANGSLLQIKILPDCDDAGGQHLNYDTATNSFTCGTTGDGGGTGSVDGPGAAAQASELPLYDENGDLIRSDGLNGILEVTSGVVGTLTSIGTGNVVRQNNPTIVGPLIVDLSNMNHTHQNSAQGGQLNPANAFSATIGVAQGGTGTTTSTGTGSTVLSASPVFTGVPAAPTAAAETNTTQLATTAYVQAELAQTQWVTAVQLEDIVAAGSCSNCAITVDANGRVTGYATGSTVLPGGSNTQVQFNDSGSLAGDGGLIFNKTTDALTAAGPITSSANATAGGYFELNEDTDLGTSTWKIDLAATNLAGNFSITPGTDGKLSAASLLTTGSTTATQLGPIEHDSIVLCGQNVNNTTTYLGPGVTGYLGTPTDYVMGGAACDALDNTTEATADAPIATNFPAFKLHGFYCRLSSDPANDVVLTMRSAAAGLTPAVTCTVAGTGTATSCRALTSTTTDIAAGATIAMQVATTEDLSAQDVWCKAYFSVQ